MAKQTINIGNIVNDGSGDTLRVGATKINSNFNEIYSKLGNGSDISLSLDFTTPPTEGQVLQFNSLTGKFVPGEAGARGQIGPAGPQGPAGPIGPQGLPGEGNVNGPGSSTLNAIARFNGTIGREIKNSNVIISDAGAIVAPVASSVIPFYFAGSSNFPSASNSTGAIVLGNTEGKMYFSHDGEWIGIPREDGVVTSITGTGGIIASGSTGNISLTLDPNINFGGNDSSGFAGLADSLNAGLTIDEIAHPAIHKITMTAVDNSGWQALPYTGTNPTVYAISGTTIAFKIGPLFSGGNFTIQDPSNNNYDTGLYHVDVTGIVSEDAGAQSKDSGTLYWRIPFNVSGTYKYTCLGETATMTGNIVIKNITTI